MSIVTEYDWESDTMTHHDARSAFRATVAEVAARAKERLPQAVNGRIARAVKLVLGHDVTPQADGSIEVGSSTDPLKVYHLVGHACDCQDFTHGKAPDGWCAHRIAAGIQKRVQELLPQGDPLNTLETTGQPTPPALPLALPEAPASVNVRLTIDGRDVQLTLRGVSEEDVLQRLAAVLKQYPLSTAAPGAAPVAAPTCKYHGAMKASSKAPGTFYCTRKLADGSYCPSRFPEH